MRWSKMVMKWFLSIAASTWMFTNVSLSGSSATSYATESVVTYSATTPDVWSTENQEVKPPNATPDVQSAVSIVKTLPTATNPHMAETNQTALLPSVQATIAARHARQLVDTTKSPDAAADLLRLGGGIQTINIHSPKNGTVKPPAPAVGIAARRSLKTTAHSASCCSSAWSQTFSLKLESRWVGLIICFYMRLISKSLVLTHSMIVTMIDWIMLMSPIKTKKCL